MRKLCIIFNPAARGAKSRRTLDFLAAKATSESRIMLAPTQASGEATRLAAKAVQDGFEAIVAAGGDGTINEVVNGIGLSGLPLAVLPGGTANVFAREHGIPTGLEAAWAVIERGNMRTIDLGCVESSASKRYFAQLAGVGLDAVSVRGTSWRLKKRIGPLSYIWAGLKAIATHRAEVDVRGGKVEARGGLVLIGNGRLYGGQFAVFPEARCDDGLLDVCVFHNHGYVNVLRYLQGVMRGVHTGFKDVTYFQCERVACTSGERVPFEVEGDLAGEVPATFSIVPRALNVVV